MNKDRQTILSLVAMGRITPAEAERLLIAWNSGRELLWLLAAAVLLCALAQFHVDGLLGLAHAVHALARPGSLITHHALALVNHVLEGIQ
jgi:CHASE2 domain-containing sensor protein